MSLCVHHHDRHHLILLCCTECSVKNCKKCHPRHPNRCLKCDAGFSLIAPHKCTEGSTDICSQLYYAFIFDSLVLFVRQMYRVMLFYYMNFISPNTAAQYTIERKIEIQNIQAIQKNYTELYKKSKLVIGFNKRNKQRRIQCSMNIVILRHDFLRRV